MASLKGTTGWIFTIKFWVNFTFHCVPLSISVLSREFFNILSRILTLVDAARHISPSRCLIRLVNFFHVTRESSIIPIFLFSDVKKCLGMMEKMLESEISLGHNELISLEEMGLEGGEWRTQKFNESIFLFEKFRILWSNIFLSTGTSRNCCRCVLGGNFSMQIS